MSTPLLPVILEAGLNAIWRASNDGVSAQITHVALGDGAHTPNQGMTRLKSERARYPVADGKRLSSRLIHLTALADGDAEFWVREVGFVLADGTLLALWSSPDKPLAYKAAGVDLLLAYDLTLSAVPAESVTVQSTGAGLNLALAEEVAALAGAQVGEMLRGVGRDEGLAALLRAQQAGAWRISNAEQELTATEQRRREGREGILSASMALSASHLAEQLRGIGRDETLEALHRAQQVSVHRIDSLRAELDAAEYRWRAVHEGVLCTVIAMSAAVINLQRHVAKSMMGE